MAELRSLERTTRGAGSKTWRRSLASPEEGLPDSEKVLTDERQRPRRPVPELRAASGAAAAGLPWRVASALLAEQMHWLATRWRGAALVCK